jgi:hypothetical protein
LSVKSINLYSSGERDIPGALTGNANGVNSRSVLSIVVGVIMTLLLGVVPPWKEASPIEIVVFDFHRGCCCCWFCSSCKSAFNDDVVSTKGASRSNQATPFLISSHCLVAILN